MCSIKKKTIHLHICYCFVYLSILISVYLSICLFFYLSIFLSVYLSNCLFVYLSIRLSVFFLSVYLSCFYLLINENADSCKPLSSSQVFIRYSTLLGYLHLEPAGLKYISYFFYVTIKYEIILINYHYLRCIVWTRLTRVECFNWLAHYRRIRIGDKCMYTLFTVLLMLIKVV